MDAFSDWLEAVLDRRIAECRDLERQILALRRKIADQPGE